MRSYIICNEMDMARNTHDERRNAYRVLVGKLEENKP
jgi:hypothetical protein